MTQKHYNTYIVVGTIILMLAGTGLTFFNNADFSDSQQTALAIVFAAAFSAAEVGFILCHKVFESVSKRWRKVAMFITMFLLLGAMAFAFFQELGYAFQKQKGKTQSNIATRMLEQTRSSRVEMAIVKKFDIDIKTPEMLPFVLCYFLAGISYVMAGVCYEKKRRRIGIGAIPLTPQTHSAVSRKIAMSPDPNTIKLYRDNKGNGYSVRVNGQYAGFITDKEINGNASNS